MIASFLYNIFIMPIQLCIEIVFHFLFTHLHDAVAAIVGVSLFVNILCLPLYSRADALQAEERERQKKLSRWVEHIRKSFKGDERYLRLNTYYRQQGYRPIYALRASFSLLLQIPFFMAAYNFLSGLSLLSGCSFGPVADLAAPDALIKLGGLSINLLPILMTLINWISAAIYSKGFSFREKAQIYGISLVFLVLLYDSPSGLVLYWTCNNLFSLGKNIVAGFLPKKEEKTTSASVTENDSLTPFILSGLFNCVLLGLLIPSAVLASAPADFLSISGEASPLSYLFTTVSLGIGFFVFWAMILFIMIPADKKPLASFCYLVIAFGFLANYMLFPPSSKDTGVLSAILIYQHDFSVPLSRMLLNTVFLAGLILLLLFLYRKIKVPVHFLLTILLISMLLMSGMNIHNASAALQAAGELNRDELPAELLHLDKDGQNVIVFMLDKADSGFVPFIFNEKPGLIEQFSGFTYYQNTVSAGGNTVLGSPSLFGGYEYTPLEIQKRNDVSLREKHNEALLTLPRIFSEAGFETIVCDPPYANYSNPSDLSIYAPYKGISSYITSGRYATAFHEEIRDLFSKRLNRNLFMYSLFRVTPLFIQKQVYNGGKYHNPETLTLTDINNGEKIGNFTNANALNDISELSEDFVNGVGFLENLPAVTGVSAGSDNTGSYCQLVTELTHGRSMLQLPDYTLSLVTDNSGYNTTSRTDSEGNILDLTPENVFPHYNSNMAAFLYIGKWMEALKDMGVYDNTRIILVSDHADDIGIMHMEYENVDLTRFNALLMMKDFGETGNLKTSEEFMTTADVPFLATKNLIEEPVNPFSGKPILARDKIKEPPILNTSTKVYDQQDTEANVFDLSDGLWLQVCDDIFDLNNWSLFEP